MGVNEYVEKTLKGSFLPRFYYDMELKTNELNANLAVGAENARAVRHRKPGTCFSDRDANILELKK
jgi:hypothetical protein